MFTGIIQTLGAVRARHPAGDSMTLALEAVPGGVGDLPTHAQAEHRHQGSGPITRFAAHPPEPGESICVSGCCLTLTKPVQADGLMWFDVIAETLKKTTLSQLKVGDLVNLERSLTAQTLLDGHIVQGHVECRAVANWVAKPEDQSDPNSQARLQLSVPPSLLPSIVPKGSIAVDGVSLTIASVDIPRARFEVALIPTTLNHTTLGRLTKGDQVNIETDIFARTIVHTLKHFRDADMLG